MSLIEQMTPEEAYEEGYRNGESSLLADVNTLCDQLGIEVEELHEFEAIRRAYRGAVDVIHEWLAASDALKAVDTSNGQAIKAALARLDAAKADARRLGGQ